MKPRFTACQLARQERWRHEERFALATTIINSLMSIPILAFLFPFIIPIASMAMTWINYGLQHNRNKILHEEQQALNANRKDMILKKDSLLTQLSQMDEIAEPSNISNGSINKVPRVVDGGIGKLKHVGTAFVRPANIMLDVLKSEGRAIKPTNIIPKTEGGATPSNISFMHKR